MSKDRMKFMDDFLNIEQFTFDQLKLVQLAIEYILNHKHKEEKLTIGEITKGIGYSSESHVKNVFRKVTGRTLGSVVRDVRLAPVIDMLIHTKQSFSSIAEEFSFDDNNFSRYIKDNLGASPTMFRMNNLFNRHNKLTNSIKFNMHSLVWELLINKVFMEVDDDRPALSESVTDPEAACLKDYIKNGFNGNDILEEVYIMNPKNPLTNVLLGMEYHLAGNNDEAYKYFKAAIEGAIDDTRFLNIHECYLIYAMFLHGMDDYAAAQISINVAHHLPDSYLANFYAGLYTLHGERRVDFENLKSELDEYDPGADDGEYFEEAIVPLMEEVADDAALCEGYFSKAIKLNPNFAPAYYYRAYILDCQNKKSDSDYRKARELEDAFSVKI